MSDPDTSDSGKSSGSDDRLVVCAMTVEQAFAALEEVSTFLRNCQDSDATICGRIAIERLATCLIEAKRVLRSHFQL